MTLERDVAALRPSTTMSTRRIARCYEYDPDRWTPESKSATTRTRTGRSSGSPFAAAYGNERVPLVLFIPRSSRPPYQVVVYFPGSDATRATSSRNLYTQWVEFLVRSGRAVAFPIYQQTYERRRKSTGPNFLREISLHRGLDLRRTSTTWKRERISIARDRVLWDQPGGAARTGLPGDRAAVADRSSAVRRV